MHDHFALFFLRGGVGCPSTPVNSYKGFLKNGFEYSWFISEHFFLKIFFAEIFFLYLFLRKFPRDNRYGMPLEPTTPHRCRLKLTKIYLSHFFAFDPRLPYLKLTF